MATDTYEEFLAPERSKYDSIWRYNSKEYAGTCELRRLMWLQKERPLIWKTISSALCVGAGDGAAWGFLMSHGIDAHACDFSAECTKFFGSHPDRFRVCAAHAMPYDSGAFDLVSCCDVLEHIPFEVIGPSLRELCRVSRQWVLLQIHRGESTVIRSDLHVTVRTHSWWSTQIAKTPAMVRMLWEDGIWTCAVLEVVG